MKPLSPLRWLLDPNLRAGGAVSGVEYIEFSRLAKVSKGLMSSYRLTRGEYFRHSLYATLYHTLKHHARLFTGLEPVLLQWGDYLPAGGSSGFGSGTPRTEAGASRSGRAAGVPDPTEGKGGSGRKRVYAEHGWLPRSTYQLSSRGCNSRNHIRFSGDGDYVRLVGGYERLQRLKSNLRAGFGTPLAVGPQYGDRHFFLVALQPKSGNDLGFLQSRTVLGNCRQELAGERLGQALIDHVESVAPSCRIIFTQHPGDHSRSRYRVRSGNTIVYAGQGPRTIDLVRHANCRGVIAINSNILHEALLWERPTLALGELQAAPSVESPFSGELQDFLGREGELKAGGEAGDQYLAMLLAYQWTLADLQEPLIVREILGDVDALVPCVVRRECGSCP